MVLKQSALGVPVSSLAIPASPVNRESWVNVRILQMFLAQWISNTADIPCTVNIQSSVLDVSIRSTPDATTDSLTLDLSSTSTARSTQELQPPECPSMDLLDPSSTGVQYLEQHEVDAMLQLAYGSSLVLPEHQGRESEWISRWDTVTQFTGSHYTLPRGSCGCRFITMLTEEIQLLVNGSFPSEQLIVFSSAILQQERSVSKTHDIIRSLN